LSAGRPIRALSLSRLAYDLENIVSPMLAGLLLAVISYNSLFFGTMVGFAASAALVLSIVLPSPKPSEPRASMIARPGASAFIWPRPVCADCWR